VYFDLSLIRGCSTNKVEQFFLTSVSILSSYGFLVRVIKTVCDGSNIKIKTCVAGLFILDRSRRDLFILKGNQMTIYEVVEFCNLERDQLTPKMRQDIISSYTQTQWLGVAKRFLRGLDRQHQVPGKHIQKLYDFINYHEERKTWTWEQQWNAMAIVIDYWQEMSCESRAELML
jgi:hypothetical protein